MFNYGVPRTAVRTLALPGCVFVAAFRAYENCLCFFPEWVYNGDGGVASVFYGFEMGQHCMINWIQHNLMFDDGKSADERLPLGFAGWIKSVCEE